MDQKPVRTFNVVMNDIVILLLSELAKKHPTSEASIKAAALQKEFVAVSKPTETPSYTANLSTLGIRKIEVDEKEPPRVPLATDESRPRDDGEDAGVSGIGNSADLIG